MQAADVRDGEFRSECQFNSFIGAPCMASARWCTRCYFNVRSKADISQLNLPHGLRQMSGGQMSLTCIPLLIPATTFHLDIVPCHA